jgi:hypothetical protein
MGLEGAIRGVRWHYLPEEVKNELREFYSCHGCRRNKGSE